MYIFNLMFAHIDINKGGKLFYFFTIITAFKLKLDSTGC